MKKIILVFTLLVSIAVQAQKRDTTAGKNKTHFKLSINYNTGLNYLGRTDSLKSTGVFALAELWLNKNFYVNLAPVFIHNRVQAFDYAGTVASIGYQNITEKWITGLYVLKPFYKASSQLVQSALKAQSGINISRQHAFLNINAGADIKFSDKADVGATAGVDHLIRRKNKNGSIWVFDPTLSVHAGSQNFTRTYNKKTGGFLIFPGAEQQVNEQVQQFSLLAYEASLPVIYAANHWMFIATPAFIMPQNLVRIEGRPDLSETGQNLFYATLAVKYTF